MGESAEGTTAMTRNNAAALAAMLIATWVLAWAVVRIPGLERWAGLASWLLWWGLGCVLIVALISQLERDESDSIEAFGDSDAAQHVPLESVVRRNLRIRMLTHPTTLLPALVALSALVALYLLAPSAEARWVLVAAATVGVAVMLTSGAWHYRRAVTTGYVDLLAGAAGRAERARAAAREHRLESLRSQLQAELTTEGVLPGGLGTLEALDREHSLLLTALRERRDSDPLAVSVLPALADETYRRGVEALGVACDLDLALRAPGAGFDTPQTSSAARVGSLLTQAKACAAALNQTRVELISLRAGGPEVDSSDVIEALQQAIGQARDIQVELEALRLNRRPAPSVGDGRAGKFEVIRE